MKNNKENIPYFIRIFWSEEDGCYIAEVPELKGCSGLGETPDVALNEAVRSMRGWLEVAKKEGIAVPEPISRSRTERLNLRLPSDVIEQIKREAKENHMSINQYLLWRLAA